MHTTPDTLGDIVKHYRQRAGITIESLSTKVEVTERYLYRIENEGQKPSYDVLYKLVRELSILPDLIFYPEKKISDCNTQMLIRSLSSCDERSMAIITATVKAALESQEK